MKKILSYLKKHIREDFRLGYYSTIALFLAITIAINYYLDFEDAVIDVYQGEEIRVLWYFIFYVFAYYSAFFINQFFNKRKDFKIRKFWILSLVGILILSIDKGFPYTYDISVLLPTELYPLGFKIVHNLASLFTVFLPLFFVYKLTGEEGSFYGLTFKGVDYKPYAIMLLIMFPLIFLASFQPDFLRSYPTYPANEAAEYLQIPEWATALFYELCYGWDFVSVELLFRGFLVIGLARVIGKEAIIPMVVTYAFLHFGKPLGETIGSIFGGYILGVIALYSRNIWGGVAIHLGVAWLMEFCAFLQKIR